MPAPLAPLAQGSRLSALTATPSEPKNEKINVFRLIGPKGMLAIRLFRPRGNVPRSRESQLFRAKRTGVPCDLS